MEIASEARTASIVPTRVGVILGDLGKLNVLALKYLIVHLNTLQASIEFEILAIHPTDPLLASLGHRRIVDRNVCRSSLPGFRDRVIRQIAIEQQQYELADKSVPEGL